MSQEWAELRRKALSVYPSKYGIVILDLILFDPSHITAFLMCKMHVKMFLSVVCVISLAPAHFAGEITFPRDHGARFIVHTCSHARARTHTHTHTHMR